MRYSKEEKIKYREAVNLITAGLSREKILKSTKIDVLTVPPLKDLYERVQARRR